MTWQGEALFCLSIMNWQSLWSSIQPHLIVWANGFLFLAYWAWDNAALLIALACGIVITLTYDRAVQRTAGDRLMRYGCGTRVQASYRSQVESFVTILVWTMAAMLSPAHPVHRRSGGNDSRRLCSL
jgi:hypothetical protein